MQISEPSPKGNASPLIGVLLLIGGSFSLAFGQGHWPSGSLVICGVALSARFFDHTRPLIALPVFVVAHVLVWEWSYAGMVPLPVFARIAMECGISLVLSLIFVLSRWTTISWGSVASTLVLPCGWVMFDLLTARFSPGGSWGSIAYSFADSIVVSQTASVLGWTGLVFFAVWLGSLLNWTTTRWLHDKAEARKGILLSILLVAAVCSLGVGRILTAPSAPKSRVACVIPPNIFNAQSIDAVWAYTRGVERPASSVASAQSRIEESLEEHFIYVERAADSGAQLIVWPEANPVITAAEESWWLQRAQEVARGRGIYIGMGMVVYHPESGAPASNKFVLVDPAGEVTIDFLKATRVPGTNHAKGDGVLPVVASPLGRITTAICFDLDFPHLIRQAGSKGTDVLLAPSNDWDEAAETHARMARLRAIEQGVAMIRPTKDGVTTMVDSSGRMIGKLQLKNNEEGMLIAELPTAGRRTIYSAIGDSFGWACAVVFLILLYRAKTST
ncbi:MAG: nitrilase-related carbon-nitrogen hydrolase [Phycisphaerales bacterium JB043]